LIERLAQPRIAGKPSGHDAAFTGSLGHWGGATKRPQSMVVSALQGLPAFCEQRGKDDPAVSWQGCQDRRVALLTGFPRFFLRRFSQLVFVGVSCSICKESTNLGPAKALPEVANALTLSSILQIVTIILGSIFFVFVWKRTVSSNRFHRATAHRQFKWPQADGPL
jgi:hypothetical protein